MLDYHDTIRCPVCRKQARVWVQILTTGNGTARREVTFACPSRCAISPMQALRLADPMAC